MRLRSGMTELTLPPGVRSARIEPLWRRVDRNRFKTVVLTFLFALAVTACIGLVIVVLWFAAEVAFAVIGFAAWEWSAPAAGRFLAYGAPGAFMLVLLWVLVRLASSERFLLKRFGARITNKGEFLPSKNVLKDMAIAAGFEHAPPLYVIETGTVNAFALGRSYKTAVVGITSGFVARIPPEQQRAVFANLVSRIRSLDIMNATTLSALMGPIWAMRDSDLTVLDSADFYERDDDEFRPWQGSDRWAGPGSTLYALAVIVTEFLAWGHQENAWLSAEKADAEGMLLLKDPRSMIDALEAVLGHDNYVEAAGDAYSSLFYCWAGFGFAPEDDPEFRRVSRLRETLGAEGLARRPAPNVPPEMLPPRPPRLEDAR